MGHARDRVSKSISKKRHEGWSQKQAIAASLNMEREGRLGPHGEYRKKKR